MKTKTSLVLVVAVLVTGAPSTANAAGKKRDRCYGVNVFGVDASSEVSKRPKRRFSVREVDALEFRVRLRANRPGSHRVEIKLYTPNGDLYQTLTTIHQSPTKQPTTERERRRAQRRRWEYATLRVPVAATTIVRSSLYGRWRAEAYLDGSSRSCTRPRRFRIKP